MDQSEGISGEATISSPAGSTEIGESNFTSLTSNLAASKFISDIFSSIPTNGSESLDGKFDPVRIEVIDDDEEGDGEGDGDGLATGSSYMSKSFRKYSNDTAPLPCNCCGFSTIGCARFWAIFNLVQLFFSWMIVCFLNTAMLMGEADHDRKDGPLLRKCLEVGSAAARGTELALQIILLLIYSSGSVIFTIAVFPPEQVLLLELQPLFTKVYIGTCLSFLLAYILPVLFHLAVDECLRNLISLLVWVQIVTELVLSVAVLYFAWRITKIFRNYLNESVGYRTTASGKCPTTPPPTPKLSLADTGIETNN